MNKLRPSTQLHQDGATTGEVLEWDGTKWTPSASGGGMVDPTTTKGDLIAHGGTNGTERLPVGADGHVLTADSAAEAGVSWQTPASGGMADPTTTKGDLIVHGGTNGTERLAIGTDGYVLTADSTVEAGVSWQAGGAGGGTLEQLTDVNISTTPADGSWLYWNNAAGKWEAKAAPNVPTGTSSVVFAYEGDVTAGVAVSGVQATDRIFYFEHTASSITGMSGLGGVSGQVATVPTANARMLSKMTATSGTVTVAGGNSGLLIVVRGLSGNPTTLATAANGTSLSGTTPSTMHSMVLFHIRGTSQNPLAGPFSPASPDYQSPWPAGSTDFNKAAIWYDIAPSTTVSITYTNADAWDAYLIAFPLGTEVAPANNVGTTSGSFLGASGTASLPSHTTGQMIALAVSVGFTTLATPTGWTLVGSQVSSDNSTERVYFFVRVTDGTEGATITLTPGSGNPVAWAMTTFPTVTTASLVRGQQTWATLADTVATTTVKQRLYILGKCNTATAPGNPSGTFKVNFASDTSNNNFVAVMSDNTIQVTSPVETFTGNSGQIAMLTVELS